MQSSTGLYRFLASRIAAGERVALVTVTDVTGSSVRNPGAQMAISECGAYAGTLSGGCIERAVIAEAQAAIAARAPHRIAYGAGSPIIDIRLPCGGRVDLLFSPLEGSDAVVEEVLAAHAARKAVSLRLPTSGDSEARVGADCSTAWDKESATFAVRLPPPLRLVIAGHGGTVEALLALAAPIGAACEVLTPDAELAERVTQLGISSVRVLETPRDTASLTGDPWTAFTFFFHDHDWEGALLAHALAQLGFYIGAMGSRKTHADRVAGLHAVGIGETETARITSPIGLIPSSRDPETLALSALAQVVERYNATLAAQQAALEQCEAADE